jgi:hypothetical protein
MPVLQFDFDSPISTLQPPKNPKSLAIFLLLESGKRGINTYEAIKDCCFYKFPSRVSDLISDYGLEVHKKNEPFVNRFGAKTNTVRYCLYENQMEKNIELYNRLNQ